VAKGTILCLRLLRGLRLILRHNKQINLEAYLGVGISRHRREERSPQPTAPIVKNPRWKLGLAVFQNDKSPTNGVACVHGRQPIMFDSRTSLPSDVIWISSADQGDVTQNFRPKSFLRSTLDAVADDLGVELRDVVGGMPLMARLLQQVVEYRQGLL